MPDEEHVRYVIEIGASKKRVSFYKAPSPQELNLLFVLVEAAGVVVHPDALCHRLKTSLNGVRIIATKLRKKLTGEWVVDTRNNLGMRLLYAPYQTDEPDLLASNLREVLLNTPAESSRAKLRQHEESSKQKIGRGVKLAKHRRIMCWARENLFSDNDSHSFSRYSSVGAATG